MIYLHIGLPKSGSSAIQVYLNERQRDLLAHGVLYPWPHGYQQRFRTSGGNARPILKIARSGYPRVEVGSLREQLQQFTAEYEKVIISSEALSVFFNDPMDLRRLLPDTAEVRVVIYFRNQVDKFVSDINQTIKNARRTNYGLGEPWLSFNNYHEQIQKWCRVFGESNLLLRGYDKSFFPEGDVVADFCALLDIPYLGYDKSTPINPSLGAFHLEVMRCVNVLATERGETGWKIKQKIKDLLWCHSVEVQQKRSSASRATYVAQADIETIVQALSVSNARVADEYGVQGLDLSRAMEKYEFAHPHGNEMSVAELLFFMEEQRQPQRMKDALAGSLSY